MIVPAAFTFCLGLWAALPPSPTVRAAAQATSSATSSPSTAPEKKKVVLLAGRASHGFGAHDHYAGAMLMAKWLNENTPDIAATVHRNGWPAANGALDGASAVIMYCDGDTGHPALAHLAELDALAKKGVGLGMIHFAVEIPKGPGGDKFLSWVGGYFEVNWSVNPHWKAEFTSIPEHEVTRGVKPFSTRDEWYFHMRFQAEMKGVTPILSAVPPDSIRSQPDGPRSNNPAIRAEVGKNTAETLMWVYDRPDGGRGFGFTGGHFHWNWAQDDQRRLILNSIAWIAKAQIPPGGINSPRPNVDDLLTNPDETIPANLNKATRQAELDAMNAPATRPAPG